MVDPLHLISERVHPSLCHLIEPGTLLSDLQLEQVDLWGIQCAIEEAGGFEFKGEPAWATVGDVIDATKGKAHA